MKSFTIAASAMLMASLASGRVINKARADPEYTVSTNPPSYHAEPEYKVEPEYKHEQEYKPTTTAAHDYVIATAPAHAPVEAKPVRNGFELDVTTTKLGVQNFFSRDEEKIIVVIAHDDHLVSTVLRSVNKDVICTIREGNSSEDQIRKIGGDLSFEFKPAKGDPEARTIECFFEGEDPREKKW